MDFEKHAKDLLYELWYSYAERLLERVVQECEQAEALRQVYLRPNDFMIELK